MRADSCSGPTTDSICGHGLGRMGHSSNFARWPHLGPIPPMDGGGHLGPLSYVYGYRGGIGRRGVGKDTTGDDGIEIRVQVRRYQLIPWRCAAGFVPKSAIWTMGRCGGPGRASTKHKAPAISPQHGTPRMPKWTHRARATTSQQTAPGAVVGCNGPRIGRHLRH